MSPTPAPTADTATTQVWADALWAIAAVRLDPLGLGGVRLRAGHGPVRDHWLHQLTACGPTPVRVPLHSDDAALLGGMDLGATLQHGRLQWQSGLLAQAHGKLLILPMAERAPRSLLARLAQALDRRCVTTPQGAQQPCECALVALDEADADEAGLHEGLSSRLGLWLDLHALPWGETHLSGASACDDDALARARVCLAQLHDASDDLMVLAQVAAELGVHDSRALQWAWRAARASAALAGRTHLDAEDLTRAIRCVLVPRATQLPNAAAPEDAPPESAPPPPPEANEAQSEAETPPQDSTQPPPPPEDVLLAAALAQLPPHVLDQLAMRASRQRQARMAQGHSGQWQRQQQRGRPLPSRAGKPSGSARLDVLATLRHAAPRQRIRAPIPHAPHQVRLRTEDFHTRRHAQRSASCLIVALDASGSAAMQRLAQAKGAVELLLSQSYARRDQVCVIGFRGAQAQCLLPPTRSLVRAKRALAGLPGGGGTPLAAALAMSLEQALLLQREGQTPVLVVLSDGRANVTLAGLGGRTQAHSEASELAQRWASTGFAALWIDTSPQPDALAQGLAQQMQANYLPMPHLQSQRLASAMDPQHWT